MNPLSPFTYYRRHKGGTALLAMIIALVTLAVGLMVSVLDSYVENLYLDLAYLHSLASIYPNEIGEVDPGIAAQVRDHPDVERVIPDSWISIQHPALVGTSRVRVFVIPVAEMPGLLRTCAQRVQEGRLPVANAAEFALSVDTARALGLRLGDRVSRATNPNYYSALASEMTLVGLLDQDPAAEKRNVRLGLASYEYITGHEDYQPRMNGLLAVARPGRIAALSRFLEALPDKQVQVETLDLQASDIAQMGSILYPLFAMVDLMVAGVAAVVVGVINQIAISRRLPEFGLLHAVGWRKGALLRRVTGGTAVTAALGWLVGLAGMGALIALGRETVFASRGLEWSLSITPFLYSLPIPLTVVCFAVWSVWRVFGRLDAVAIVERGKLSMEENGKQHARRSSARPLSSWTFYLRHRRRGIMLVMAMALMIVGVAFPVSILMPIFDAQMPSIEYLRYVSAMWPGARSDLDPGVVAQVRAHPGTARVIPVLTFGFGVTVPPFNTVRARLNAVSEDDMVYLMDLFGLRVLEGRLPRPRTNEVVLSEALALNRGLHVGDAIGYPVDERDGCPYEMTIVGLLETDGMWMGFASLEYAQSHELTAGYSPDMFVAPGAEGKDSLDAWLLENVDSSATVVRTYEEERREIERYRLGMLMVLGVVELLVALIAAMALAVLNYIFYSQRRDEFGALHALGRVRGWLTWRAGRETLTATAAAWVIGAALCMGIAVYLQFTMFVPKGLSMDLAGIAPWLFTLPIPLAVAAASTSTIAWMLRRLDAVAVIEGR